MIIVKLKGYLQRLEAEESAKAMSGYQARRVPSLGELARTLGVTDATLSRLVNNHMTRINTDTIDQIIKLLRAQGFNTTLGDVIEFVDDTQD
jgi:DNA-binding Xre family transcriptional regulator